MRGTGARPGAEAVINEEGTSCRDGSLASLPPKALSATVQVQPGPQCGTGSEVAVNLGHWNDTVRGGS